MDKLIDVSAENMNKVFSESLCCPDDIYKFWCIANMFPTVDAVEVVRCEQCVCNDRTDSDIRRGIVWCKKICRYMKADGFCSEWERDGNS